MIESLSAEEMVWAATALKHVDLSMAGANPDKQAALVDKLLRMAVQKTKESAAS